MVPFKENLRQTNVREVDHLLNDFQRKLNGLSNYLTRSWSPETGCQICDEDRIDFEKLQVMLRIGLIMHLGRS